MMKKIKSILKRFFCPPIHKSIFWLELDKKQKIKRLAQELDEIKEGDFENLHKIAKQQQKLLQK